MVSLEVCANSVNSAVAAQEGGAFRVELCSNLNEGGTSPSFGQILVARKLINVKLYILVRPRSGDFLYNDIEFDAMKADVKYCAEMGCDGIVTGILKQDGSVDKERCGELVQLAKQAGMGVTFHRAFDMCSDLFKSLEDLVELGFERVLTSGGKSTAMEGASVIANLVNRSAGRIAIMPGSDINEYNVADLVHFTRVTEIHASARRLIESRMEYRNSHILMGGNFNDEYTVDVTDAERVRRIIELANQ